MLDHRLLSSRHRAMPDLLRRSLLSKDAQVYFALLLRDLYATLIWGQKRSHAGSTALKEGDDSRQSLTDIALGMGNATTMKGFHGELRPRLPNRLPSDDTNGHAQ